MVLGSEEVSMRKSEAFLARGERNGVACTSSWRSKNYNWSFATATADVQRQVLKDRVRALKYGVIMDESTDCAVAKQLVLYVKVQGAVLFAGMLDMAADGSGEGIKNACVQLLTDLDMERKNLTAVATDGAAAMRGSKKGATKLLSDWAEGPVFTSHCVLHRINLAVVDVFDGKSNCPDVVRELAVEIETSLRYAYSYFNRSTANRKELQTVGRAFGRCVIPHSLCETRWLFRYLAIKALWQGRDAVVGFLRDNYQRKESHEGRCILQMLVEHADKFKGTLDVMRIIFLLSTRMQTRNLSEWIVYLHFQLADRALEELTEELDMGRVKKFAKFMRVRLVERCPFMKSAQASQIHDFSMLKKSGAEFCFSKDLVCKAAHAHFAIHE